MIPSVTKARDVSYLGARFLVRHSRPRNYLKRRHLHQIMMMSCVFLPASWISVVPAFALDASGTATIQCGAFSGDPQNQPGWVSHLPYSITEDQISMSYHGSGQTDDWSGIVDSSGRILLTGAGSGGGGAWVMHFRGKWHGAGGTRLVGGYHNVRGMVGGRSCGIVL